jgi:hypothetical protein
LSLVKSGEIVKSNDERRTAGVFFIFSVAYLIFNKHKHGSGTLWK